MMLSWDIQVVSKDTWWNVNATHQQRVKSSFRFIRSLFRGPNIRKVDATAFFNWKLLFKTNRMRHSIRSNCSRWMA